MGLTSEAETMLRRHLSKGSPRFHAVIAQLQGVLAWDVSCWHSDTWGVLVLGDTRLAISGFLTKPRWGRLWAQ